MMLKTPCNYCCFLDRETKGCTAGQFCMREGDAVVAPGFCRLFRDRDWAEKHGRDVEAARNGSDLRFDLVVVFNERRHSRNDIAKTLSDVTGYDRVIVVDTTGSGEDRKGTAKELAALVPPDTRYSIDTRIEESPDAELHEPVSWGARLVKSPYFAAVDAGMVLKGMEALRLHILGENTRAVYWHFPFRYGGTLVARPRLGAGVYITKAYTQLGGTAPSRTDGEGNRVPGTPYPEKLAELGSDWSLTWLFDRGVVE